MCDHFRRNISDGNDPNEGTCTRYSPKGRGAFTGGNAGTSQDLSGAKIEEPETTWCGDFKKWTGADREIIVVVE